MFYYSGETLRIKEIRRLATSGHMSKKRHVLGPSNFKIELHVLWLGSRVNTLQLLQSVVKDFRGQLRKLSFLETDETVKRDIIISEKQVNPGSDDPLAMLQS